MVTINVKKLNDFDTRPELGGVKQTFSSLENIIAKHKDTPLPAVQPIRYLMINTSQLKKGNLSARTFDDCQNCDEGNSILETLVSITPTYLTLDINMNEVGITEGRGSFELRPVENGLLLQVQEIDCFKNSPNQEAHAVMRNILRNYTVNGDFNWKNATHCLKPNGVLSIHVNVNCSLNFFPQFKPENTYSSISRVPQLDFPSSNPYMTFPMFAMPQASPPTKCPCCVGTATVGVQIGDSLLQLMPSEGTSCGSSVGTMSSSYSSFCESTPSNKIVRHRPCICSSDSTERMDINC